MCRNAAAIRRRFDAPAGLLSDFCGARFFFYYIILVPLVFLVVFFMLCSLAFYDFLILCWWASLLAYLIKVFLFFFFYYLFCFFFVFFVGSLLKSCSWLLITISCVICYKFWRVLTWYIKIFSSFGAAGGPTWRSTGCGSYKYDTASLIFCSFSFLNKSVLFLRTFTHSLFFMIFHNALTSHNHNEHKISPNWYGSNN